MSVTLRGGRSLGPRFDEFRRRAHVIESLVGDGANVTDSELAAMADMSRGQLVVMRHLLVAIGALRWEGVQGAQAGSAWRMVKKGADLDAALTMEMERQMRGGGTPETQAAERSLIRRTPPTTRSAERPAVATDRLGFTTGAIIGPEAPKAVAVAVQQGQNAPAALILAAKQHRSGLTSGDQRKALALVKELNDMGISVPAELAAKAAPRKDARLDAIVLILPYVEDIERRLVRAEDQLRHQEDYGALRQRVEQQRRQIDRLVAQRVGEALSERPNNA